MEFAFLDLLNTDWRDWRGSGREEDRLDQPGFIEEFLAAWGLNSSQVDRAALPPALKVLRTLIRSVMESAARNEPLAGADLASLNRYLLGAPYRQKLVFSPSPGESALNDKDAINPGSFESHCCIMEWEPLSQNVDWVLARITESFAQVLLRGDARRLKICANPDCGWAFYDSSRAMTRTWCDSRACGNLMKVRRFREKHKSDDRATRHVDGK